MILTMLVDILLVIEAITGEMHKIVHTAAFDL